jgi:hypothetical protein
MIMGSFGGQSSTSEAYILTAQDINLGLSDELKLSFPDIKPISRLLLSHRSAVLKNNLVGISSATPD